jgi:hypothetical protein
MAGKTLSPDLPTYLRLLAKGEREGITVLGEDFTYEHQPCWIVPSSRHKQRYIVTLIATGFTCSCPAGRDGVYCKHRAVVRNYLIMTARRAALEAMALAEGWTQAQWAEALKQRTPQPQSIPAGYVVYDGGPTCYRPIFFNGRPYVPTR